MILKWTNGGKIMDALHHYSEGLKQPAHTDLRGDCSNLHGNSGDI